MATTTNYSWTTPDDTALVKDGASAIRTLGSSADTTVKNLNPGTTAGDIDYYTSSTAKARIALGTAGQVLQVNSGATAPEWGARPGGSNWSLLNAGGTNLTAATTITVSGISSVDKVAVLIDGGSSASADSIFTIRFNADSGSNYQQFGLNFTSLATYNAEYYRKDDALTQTSITIANMSGVATSTVGAYLTITGCNSAGLKYYEGAGGGFADGSTSSKAYVYGGFYNSVSTISSVSIISSVGNFDAGKIYVYTSA